MEARESIHSVFLHHAMAESGMDVGIINAKEMIAYDDLKPDMLTLCDNVVFHEIEGATDGSSVRPRARLQGCQKEGAAHGASPAADLLTGLVWSLIMTRLRPDRQRSPLYRRTMPLRVIIPIHISTRTLRTAFV